MQRQATINGRVQMGAAIFVHAYDTVAMPKKRSTKPAAKSTEAPALDG